MAITINNSPKIGLTSACVAIAKGFESWSKKSNSISKDTAKGIAFGSESFSDEAVGSINSSMNTIRSQIKDLARDHMYKASAVGAAGAKQVMASEAQIEAATWASLYAADPQKFLTSAPSTDAYDKTISHVSADSVSVGKRFGVEAYDERNNSNTESVAVAYNLACARQIEVFEDWFPTHVVGHDVAGATAEVTLAQLFSGFTHTPEGNYKWLGKINIIETLRNAKLFKNDQNKLIPVYRAGTNDTKFVDTAIVAPSTYDNEGTPVLTSYLRTKGNSNIIAISQTDAQLAAGAANNTDSLEANIILTNILLSFGTGQTRDAIDITTFNHAQANFIAGNGVNRTMNLALQWDSLALSMHTTRTDGTALGTLTELATNHYNVFCRVVVSGTANLESGNITVNGSEIEVREITNVTTGIKVAVTDPSVAALVAKIHAGDIVGYKVDAYSSNLNRRLRGDLLDRTPYRQQYNVGLRSPITILTPPGIDNPNEPTFVTDLVNTTKYRQAQDALTRIFKLKDELAAYTATQEGNSLPSEEFGVCARMIKPMLKTIPNGAQLDMTDIQNLTQDELLANAKARIVTALGDLCHRLNYESGYELYTTASNGGTTPRTTVMVLTDPVTEQYLIKDGDTRLVGNKFDVRIGSCWDSKMIYTDASGNKVTRVFFTFGQFEGQNSNEVINPFHFGNMLYSPELVFKMAVPRSGGISHETTVTPRYRHIVNLPLLGYFEIKGLPDIVITAPPVRVNSL